MAIVDVHDADARLSRLLARAQAGETITLARNGVPIATLVPVAGVPDRTFGPMVFSVPDDFDAPLPGLIPEDPQSLT